MNRRAFLAAVPVAVVAAKAIATEDVPPSCERTPIMFNGHYLGADMVKYEGRINGEPILGSVPYKDGELWLTASGAHFAQINGRDTSTPTWGNVEPIAFVPRPRCANAPMRSPSRLRTKRRKA